MKIIVKQLQHYGENIAPQTVSDAVLVKKSEQIITLTDALNYKIEDVTAPAGSGLKTVKSNQSVFISHSNSVTPNMQPQNAKVQYDTNGHIIESVPIGKKTIIVNGKSYLELDSPNDESINLGDDFTVGSDKDIKLTWKNT